MEKMLLGMIAERDSLKSKIEECKKLVDNPPSWLVGDGLEFFKKQIHCMESYFYSLVDLIVYQENL